MQESNLRVELASTADVSSTIQLAKEPGAITFFDSLDSFASGAPVPEGAKIVFTEQDIAQAQDKLKDGDFYALITFTPKGRQRFTEYTTYNIGHCLVIARDGRVISSPRIQGSIHDGKAIIYNRGDASIKSLSAILNSGRLPFSLRVVEITRQ